MTNLTELLTQWIGEDKLLWRPTPLPKGKEGIIDAETAPIMLKNALECNDNTWNNAYNSALKDLKSRIPDLERQIREELLKELQSNKSIGDVLTALRDGND